jgi:hypothetical protein
MESQFGEKSRPPGYLIDSDTGLDGWRGDFTKPITAAHLAARRHHAFALTGGAMGHTQFIPDVPSGLRCLWISLATGDAISGADPAGRAGFHRELSARNG